MSSKQSFDYKLNKKSDKPRSKRKALKYVLSLIVEDKSRFLLIQFVLLLSTSASLAIPMLLRKAIDSDISAGDFEALQATSLLILLLSFVVLFLEYLSIRVPAHLSVEILYKLRKNIFEKIQTLPLEFFAKNKTGEIIKRVNSDGAHIESFLTEGFIRMINLTFNVLFLVILMLIINLKLTLLALTTVVVSIILLFFVSGKIQELVKANLKKEDFLSNTIIRILNNLSTIKLFNVEALMNKIFKKDSEEYKKASIKSEIAGVLLIPTNDMIIRLGSIVVLIYSLMLYQTGDFTIGGITAYFIYLQMLYGPIQQFSALWNISQRGLVAADRISFFLGLENNLKVKKNAYKPDKDAFKGSVEFKNVSFSYNNDGDFVLRDISMQADEGEKIAIVGPTGAGKTTLVNLIARLYDTDKGSILIDNEDVRNWDLALLRKSVGYLLQDVFLFEDTIRYNVTYPGAEISDKELTKTINKVAGFDLVSKFPLGLDTEIGGKTKNISSGQKQILALVRLILKDPKIVILDEATSEVDTVTEEALQKAITHYIEGDKTMFIIAHRLNTIEQADKVAFVHDNRIVEYGPKEKLLKEKGMFYSMYKEFKEKQPTE